MRSQNNTTNQPANAPALTRKMARAALIGLDETTSAVLTECFHQFGIMTTALEVSDAQRLSVQKFDACALRLDGSAERVLEIIRRAPANFRMVVYGLANSTAQALRYSRFGVNAILDEPIDKRAALRVVRATHLLVVHEFRRYVRIPLATPVAIACEGRKIQGQSVELSGGGISIEAPALTVGAPVNVEFVLPKSDKLRLTATVRWHKGGLLGVRFEENDPARQKVKEWIDRYLGIG
ncbi:MAG: PilZ domain-containing protein [Terriglobales bacterium]